MGFVSGMMGPYMEPIPALGSVAMLFSLFVALVFAPWMAMRIMPSMQKLKEMASRDEKIDKKISGIHEYTIGVHGSSVLRGGSSVPSGGGFYCFLDYCFTPHSSP